MSRLPDPSPAPRTPRRLALPLRWWPLSKASAIGLAAAASLAGAAVAWLLLRLTAPGAVTPMVAAVAGALVAGLPLGLLLVKTAR